MSVQLLDKTRKINKLLHNNNSHKVVFNDICLVLGEILESNILVISKKGKVLGIKNRTDIAPIKELIQNSVGGYIDGILNERLLNILSTKENVNLATLGFEFEGVDGYEAIINPIDIAGERLGTLFIYKAGTPYSIDDIILSEYRFRLRARDEGAFPCFVGKEVPAFPSHLKRRRSPQESREELQGRATIPRVPQMCQSIPEEPVFPALP